MNNGKTDGKCNMINIPLDLAREIDELIDLSKGRFRDRAHVVEHAVNILSEIRKGPDSPD